jgi:hypothetical protein
METSSPAQVRFLPPGVRLAKKPRSMANGVSLCLCDLIPAKAGLAPGEAVHRRAT